MPAKELKPNTKKTKSNAKQTADGDTQALRGVIGSVKRTLKSAATPIFHVFYSFNCCFWSPEGLELCANNTYFLVEKALNFTFYGEKSYLYRKVMAAGTVGVKIMESARSGGTNTGGGISSGVEILNTDYSAQKRGIKCFFDA